MGSQRVRHDWLPAPSSLTLSQQGWAGSLAFAPVCEAASEKARAPHSSTLAWKIPWTEEPGRLQSMGSQRVRHDWVTSLSHIGEGNGSPLQCSYLENHRDRGAWWAAICGVTESQTRLKWLTSSSIQILASQNHSPLKKIKGSFSNGWFQGWNRQRSRWMWISCFRKWGSAQRTMGLCQLQDTPFVQIWDSMNIKIDEDRV